ncbi:hypothetical protein [Amycolatopsis sulphurea]|uniref:hypothetical protein n=1 Tax=Amycolatopsis sulphurea TaxID=76022 RepID=UPI001145669E|nr:hypothetical protein [Amycolatopsis sulphurea]
MTPRDDERITVEVTQESSSRSVIYRGQLPALIIGDGTDEVVLLAGPKFQDASLAKEFAIALAHNALTFSGAGNRRMQDFQIWPGDDPETE